MKATTGKWLLLWWLVYATGYGVVSAEYTGPFSREGCEAARQEVARNFAHPCDCVSSEWWDDYLSQIAESYARGDMY